MSGQQTREYAIDRAAMNRSIELAFAFARAEFADPAIVDQVPNGASLALIPDDDPELAARAIQAGVTAVERGKNVYFIHVGQRDDGTLVVKCPGDGEAAR